MSQYAALYRAFLDNKGTKYNNIAEHIVAITYNCDNAGSVTTYVLFDKDGGDTIQIKCTRVIGFENKPELAHQVCNDLNANYRWTKFYADDKGSINCETDAFLTEETAAATCHRLLLLLVNVIDDAYPKLAKARWA